MAILRLFTVPPAKYLTCLSDKTYAIHQQQTRFFNIVETHTPEEKLGTTQRQRPDRSWNERASLALRSSQLHHFRRHTLTHSVTLCGLPKVRLSGAFHKVYQLLLH